MKNLRLHKKKVKSEYRKVNIDGYNPTFVGSQKAQFTKKICVCQVNVVTLEKVLERHILNYIQNMH